MHLALEQLHQQHIPGTLELTVEQQHSNWLEDIHQSISYRVKFENEIPSDKVLKFHWAHSITQYAQSMKKINLLLFGLLGHCTAWEISLASS